MELTDEEYEDIENEIYFMIEEYLEESLPEYSNPLFREKMLEELINYFKNESIWEKWEFIEEIEDLISNCITDVFVYYQIPERQEDTYNTSPFINRREIQIHFLDQPLQRTPEWYQFRHDRFSASSIWKLLDSPAQYNSLIFEKCKPLDMKWSNTNVYNDYNPRNWGVKYEPISMMVYSAKHPTTILKTDYGCIPHSKYPFIGASPDGINISPECPEKYGCMVEVKNIFNREIDGIPLEEYWIQMQIQMETCNLEECDFLETRFKEYDTEEDFYSDHISEYKGLILYFLARTDTEKNKFEYMPLYISLEKVHIEQWIREMQDKYSNTHILYDRTYWYLDEYSCVKVYRNAPWFESVINKIENAWKVVENERVSGFEHRAPNSRNKIKNKTLEPMPIENISSTIKVIKLG